MTYLLNVQNLEKSFGTNKVVDDLSFQISAGECLGVIGPNGAGKTTLISTICGITRPTSCQVTVAGNDVVADIMIAGQVTARHRQTCKFVARERVVHLVIGIAEDEVAVGDE